LKIYCIVSKLLYLGICDAGEFRTKALGFCEKAMGKYRRHQIIVGRGFTGGITDALGLKE
jgi:hypothetical protein